MLRADMSILSFSLKGASAVSAETLQFCLSSTVRIQIQEISEQPFLVLSPDKPRHFQYLTFEAPPPHSPEVTNNGPVLSQRSDFIFTEVGL